MQIANKNHPKRHPTLITSVVTLLILAGIMAGINLPPLESTQAAASAGSAASISNTSNPHTVFLPILYKKNDAIKAFGVESNSSFYPNNFITNYTVGMQANYTRLNGRISWRALQETEAGPINWGLLTGFETELHTLRAANITPIIVVDDYPRWATIYPTSCGPLLSSHYDDFAIFTQALVSRYSTPEFNVHIWEMGNEPDVDPRLVPPDSNYGCWGDWDDPFYNGRAYGEMLKVVTPAIKAADPQAKVFIGGLLLNSPNTVDENIGQPEDFFRGILEAGAAPYFDMVAYHAYLGYNSHRLDADILATTRWYEWGGMLRGKASYLRAIMAEYGVDKSLFITETSQLCGWCPADYLPGLFDMQANMPARSFPRAMDAGISGFIWYTLEENFWQYSSLLDSNLIPKPVYNGYQTFNTMVANAEFIGLVGYDLGIEAYTFHKGAFRIDIIFAIEDVTYTINIPQANFIAAYDRFGVPITPTPAGSDYTLTIQYEPIYLVLTR